MKAHLLLVGRVVFVFVCAAGAWWSLRGRWAEVGQAVTEIQVPPLAGSLGLVVTGLFLTALIWTQVLAAYGHSVGLREALGVFFPGQLGKYLPGSVWSIGAQAHLARDLSVPVRASIGTGLVFLGFHVASGLCLGLLGAGDLSLDLPNWVLMSGAAAAFASTVPPVVNRLGTRVSGVATPLRLTWTDWALVSALMFAVWILYAAALAALAPSASAGLMLSLGAAFALAYAVGVVVVVAPAGLGAREATFVALLAPVLDLPTATAIALVARVVHTLADFGWAAASVMCRWWVRRSGA